MAIDEGRIIHVVFQAGVWTCFAPNELPEFHNTKHDALQCAIFWAYVRRPAQAVWERDGVKHPICTYDADGHAEFFEPFGA